MRNGAGKRTSQGRELVAGVQYLTEWYWFGIRFTARELWDGLPGPWWVKIILIIACQLIPGQIDDIALIALTAWARRHSRKKGMLITHDR